MALFGKKKKTDDVPGMPPTSDMPPMQTADPYGQAPQGSQNYYGQPQDPQMAQQQPQDMGQMQPDTSGGQFGYDQAPMPEAPAYGSDDVRERVEEIAEAIIDEKWNELMKDINKVIEWKERTDTEIKKIQQDIAHLKERFESLHKGILGKISEYDSNLTNVGTEIKAMEMAFQKILPTFTENVNRLDRMVKGKKE